MARPKSDDKRNKILAACQTAIIKYGLDATTAVIAKEAGIASGSLFTYFPTKANLFNELYIALKTEMANTLTDKLLGRNNKEKLHNAWAAWTDWAVINTEKYTVIELLRKSDQLTSETRDFGNIAIKPVFDLINANITQQRIDYPGAFLYELIDSISVVTMDKMALYPAKAIEYREAGFETLWKIITKE